MEDPELGFALSLASDRRHYILAVRRDGVDGAVGHIEVEIIKGNVVITVRRIDEAYFGPVSLVVV